jgi:class 3 adenylate cyclase/pimeloyl-ACP methyl ester carboxylesterase
VAIIDRPETRYVAVDGSDVAYQVLSDGPRDLLAFLPLGFNVDLIWAIPGSTEFWTRLASFCRVILFDRRGIGASDGVPHSAIPTWEDLTEDAGAVLDAVGSKKAVILAAQEAGPMAVLFAATHPERVSALVLVNTYARYLVADDYPIGVSHAAFDRIIELIRSSWGTRQFTLMVAPEAVEDKELLDQAEIMMRSSATPRSAAAQYDYLCRRLDVRPVVPLIEVPTLVLHAQDNPLIPIDQGRYLAEHIQRSKLVELPGAVLGLWSATPGLIEDEITEFLTGERPVEVNRILANVLFTDIVGSTGRAASLGDQRWRMLLDAHDRIVREQLSRFQGKEINTTGDGFVASFDGPARAIRCAQAIRDAITRLDIQLHMGLHTGECEVRGDDLGGLAVHIAARVAALAATGEVLVSGTVKDLVVGSGIEFIEHGEHELKGIPGRWRLFAVAS